MFDKQNKKRSFLKVAQGIAAGAACVASMSVAMPVHAVDFKGERVEWIIPFKEGGGSDTWARFYAPLLSSELPGRPVIVVKNVPGGGSTKGANQFQRRGKPNGLNVLGTSGSTQFPYLLGDKRVNYEYKDWNVVLATPTGGVVYVSSKLGIKSAAELKKLAGTKLTYGSQGATSLDLIPLLAFELLDMNINAVFGMKGRGAGRLSFERGEVNIDYQTTAAFLKKVTPLVEEGKAVPLFTWGVMDKSGELQRDPTFPDLPHFAEVYEMLNGKPPSGSAFDAWKSFYIAGFAAQKGIYLPKGTPAEVIQVWRDAAARVIAAEGFAEKSELVLGTYPQSVGKDAQKLVRNAIEIEPSAKRWVTNWLAKKYNVTL